MSEIKISKEGVNWLGLWTLCMKEIRRFLKVHLQTIVAPMVTTLLFLAVFALSLGSAVRQVSGVPYLEFLVPGLVMMAIAQNAFANTSSSVLIAKVQGNIIDLLMAPLSAGELTFGIACGGVVRGVVVGVVVYLSMAAFVGVHIHSWPAVIFYAVAASLVLSLIGMIGGIWSDKFDHMAAVTNFVVTPLSFLSGTFYSIERLPPAWHKAAQFNPFFYMIDGFRYGFIGHADGSLLVGASILTVTNLVLWCVCLVMFRRGYKLKA